MTDQVTAFQQESHFKDAHIRGRENASQLIIWVYDTSNSNLTVAERLEKSRWEAERLESMYGAEVEKHLSSFER